MELKDFRQQNPAYNDMSDTALADALHQKFYSDIPRNEFFQQIGLTNPNAAPQAQPTTAGQDISTAGRQFEQGLTLGTGDEAVAGAAAIGSKVYDYLSQGHDLDNISVGQLYKDAMANQAKDLQADKENSPILSMASQLAGGAVGAIAAGATGAGKAAAGAVGDFVRGGEVAADAGLLARGGAKVGQVVRGIGAGATTGAGIGAVQGAASADQGNRLEGATQGAEAGGSIGAVVGGATPLVSAALSPVISKISDVMTQRGAQQAYKAMLDSGGHDISSISNKALQKVVARLQADIPDHDQLMQALDHVANGDKTLAEVGGSRTTNLAQGAAQYPSGKAPAEDFIYGKLGESPDRIAASADQNISQSGNYYDELDNITANGRKQAAPLYKTAYSANMKVNSPAIKDILATPAGKSALREASAKILNDQDIVSTLEPAERNAIWDEAKALGQKLIGDNPPDLPKEQTFSLRTLDYVKRALDDKIDTAYRAGNADDARILSGMKKSLVAEMDNLDKTGAYKQARGVSGDYLSNRSAMEAGKDFHKLDALQTARLLKGYGDAEKEAFRAGVRKNISDQINNPADNTNLYKKIFGSPTQRARLEQILGKDQFAKFSDDMAAERKLYMLREGVLGNSQTAGKQIAAQEFEDGLGNLAQEAITKGPTRALIDRATGFILQKFDGLSDKTAREVAEALFEQDAQKKVALVNKIRLMTQNGEAKPAMEAFFQLKNAVPARNADVIPSDTPATFSGKIATPPVVEVRPLSSASDKKADLLTAIDDGEKVTQGQRDVLPTKQKVALNKYEKAHAIAQRNAALPVDKGGLGLPKNNTAQDRARAMGFDVENPVYHGTSADFDTPNVRDVDRTQYSALYNKKVPFFVSDDTNTAEEFSRYSHGENRGDAGPNIQKMVIKKADVFDFNKDDHIAQLEEKLYDLGDSPGFIQRIIPLIKDGEWAALENKNVQAALDDMGFKGFRTAEVSKNAAGKSSYGVSDNTQIRSVNAAFDPKKIKSGNMLAGAAGAAVVTAAAKNAKDKS